MKIIPTTAEENSDFIDLIEMSIEKAEQALGYISYMSYPEINAEMKNKIRSAINVLEDMLDADIYKPTK